MRSREVWDTDLDLEELLMLERAFASVRVTRAVTAVYRSFLSVAGNIYWNRKWIFNMRSLVLLCSQAYTCLSSTPNSGNAERASRLA